MSTHDLLAQARDTITVKRVFGDPYEKDGVTVIPAAMIMGGLGGGAGGSDPAAANGSSGAGAGLIGWPVGAYVIKDGDVTWRPAINVNLVILGGQLIAIVALLAVRGVLKARVTAARR